MYHFIALTLIPGIGPVNAKSLLGYCGSAEAVFRAKKRELLKIPGIGEAAAEAIIKKTPFDRVEEEIQFLEKSGVRCLTFTDEHYPRRLKLIHDAPLVLYYKGTADLNNSKTLGIVGTRKATEYGRHLCEQLIEELQDEQILFVSGLAYGIDIAAHKACVKRNLPNIGVLAHGLDMVYPYAHKETAKKMILHGGLLTESISTTLPDKQNFPKRNRIVAGIIDGLIVIETAENGGAVITAMLANSYNKDVMAVPGNITNPYSKGCNALIKTHRAAMIENGKDILEIMGWSVAGEKKQNIQTSMFNELNTEERTIYNIIQEHTEIGIDEISALSALTPGTIAGVLLNLEFYSLIASLPGKRYKPL